MYERDTVVMSEVAFALALWWCAAQSIQRGPPPPLRLGVLASPVAESRCTVREPPTTYLEILGDVLATSDGMSLPDGCEPEEPPSRPLAG